MSRAKPAPDTSARKLLSSSALEGRGSRVAKGLAPALALVVCAWVSTLVLAASGHRSPKTEDWVAAADYVKQSRSPVDASVSDLIVFAPSWIDPLGRQFLGDQISIEMAARMDASRYGRIFELSIGGASAPETRGLPVVSTQEFGKLRVREFTRKPAILATDFTASLKRAVVSGQMQGRPSLSLEEVGFAPHRCIKVVPRPNQEVSLRFESVILGSEIVAYLGLADVFTRRDLRAPGRLEILVNDTLVAEAKATVDNGWQRVRAETKPGQASVEFRLTAVGDNARDRRICFAAEARQ